MNRLAAFLLLLVLILGAIACGDDGGSSETLAPLTPPTKTNDEVVITIGNHTDITGVAANGIAPVNMALEDIVDYYNEENLIPGVRLKVVQYDGQYNPANDIPGYEWLKEKGADVIWTPVGTTAATLLPFLEEDEITLFTMAANQKELGASPAYVFCPGNAFGRNTSYTALKWITEHDPDFPQDRPAKIGGAYWNEAYGESLLKGQEEYAKAHPDQYEWVGSYLPDFSFIWTTEVEGLKDCDYVGAPAPIHAFAREYRNAGYDGKFVGYDAHLTFLGIIDSGDLWEEIDGMLGLRPSRWWTEEGETINLTKEILYRYHSEKEAGRIIRDGCGYLTIDQINVMLELIAHAVETVGPVNFTPQAVYDAAKSFTLTTDGLDLDTFTDTKRTSRNYFVMYEVNAEQKDLFRVGPEYYPAVLSPSE